MARLDLVNARVGARRSRLIGGDALRELLVRPTLAARVELLVRRGRLAGLPADREEAALPAVEAALRAGVRADERKLLAEVEGVQARALLAAALGVQEAQALKILLRGTAYGVAPERLVAIAPATEALPEAALGLLARASSPDDLVDRLAAEESPYARPLRVALLERDRAGLLPAELAIDRVAHGRVAAAARGGEDAAVLRDWLAGRADFRNAQTLLAMGEAVPSRDLFLPGGRRMPAEYFGRLSRGSAAARRAAVAALLSCDPGQLVDPASVDRLLERAAVRELTRAARRSPLSLAVPLAWIEARREEVRRIAVVLRGAELGLAGEVILDLVEA
jgi:V/A-type H+-transporting ATPase subunit C